MNGRRCTLAIFSGIFLFDSANPGRLRSAGICIFTEKFVTKKRHFVFEASAGLGPSREKVIPENPQIFWNYK